MAASRRVREPLLQIVGVLDEDAVAAAVARERGEVRIDEVGMDVPAARVLFFADRSESVR